MNVSSFPRGSVIGTLAGALLLPLISQAQNCALPAMPDATVTSAQDRDRMLCQLGISFPDLPPRLQDPNRPTNAWPSSPASPEGNWTDALGHTVVRTNFGLWHTYDDSAGAAGGAMSGFGDYGPFSSPRYTDIDLLSMKDGGEVATATDWWQKRRPEIFKLVQEQLYGKPIDPGIKVNWAVSAVTTGTQVVGGVDYPYREKTFTGTVDTSRYPQLRNVPIVNATCRYPAEAGKKYPAVVTYGEGVNRFQYTAPYGIGVCNYLPTQVQPDNGNTGNLSSYLIGLVTQGQWRKPDDPGALVAWGWGVSRLIDALDRDEDFDGDKIAVQGHSRYGKATLVTAAYDERVVVAWPSDAGAMGTAMARRHWGESLEFVASSTGEYHWVNGNILKYAGPLHEGQLMPRKLELLDVDAHSTTSLLAPRAIFVTNGTDTPPGFGDAWADPRGTFLSGRLASPVWNLLGWKGQIVPEGTVFTSGPGESIGGTPPFNVAFIDGTVGWRRQIEGHISTPNWPTFATFAARYLNDSRPVIRNDQKFRLGEAPLNTVGTVVAEDADENDVIGSWQIKGGTGAGIFEIDAVTGDIRIAQPKRIDFRREAYQLTVMAGDGKLPSHEAEVIVNIPSEVQICHKGRSLHVNKRAVPAHLAHGDPIGGGCRKR
ncbi:cadherin repeat domain-containing protein [Peristeroidobacter agariperforans]|uniref:cadherin repeat domain-containing protein n=1 Tax=Peristeroidobacter agariperforans TaxID=268404 RepID=UPI00101D40CC|nr:cadherin repeat domain-containing protein [Peristeroidobacter agariperforans]